MWIVAIIGLAFVALAHTAPAKFALDAMAGDRAVWHMPPDAPPTVYLTFDDGPNPATTPRLLDLLAAEQVHATFFLIDTLVDDETAPIVARIAAEGHAIGVHTATRRYMFLSAAGVAARVRAAAGRIERLSGAAPCRLFRPHAGWRSGEMYNGLRLVDYRLVGWGWMLWDWNWMRRRTADATAGRLAGRASAGDIMVMHDGDESAPRRDQRETVEAAARLIPELRNRGFRFGTLCSAGE